MRKSFDLTNWKMWIIITCFRFGRVAQRAGANALEKKSYRQYRSIEFIFIYKYVRDLWLIVVSVREEQFS